MSADYMADGICAIGTCQCGAARACAFPLAWAAYKVSDMLDAMLASSDQKMQDFACWYVEHFEEHGGVTREITTFRDVKVIE